MNDAAARSTLEVRKAQSAAARMVEARNAMRARVIRLQAERPTAPDAQARLDRVRRQYDLVRDGAREALDQLAALVARCDSEAEGRSRRSI